MTVSRTGNERESDHERNGERVSATPSPSANGNQSRK